MRAAESALHEEILLAAHHRPGGAGVRAWSRELGFALTAAVLLELHRQSRIAIGPAGVLYGKDAAEAPDPVSDALLERILLAPRAHRAHRWLQREGATVLALTTGHLLRQGHLSARPRKRWGILPTTEHTPSDPARAARTHDTIRTAAAHPARSTPPATTAAALLCAANLSLPLGLPRTDWSACPAPVPAMASEVALTLALARIPPVLA